MTRFGIDVLTALRLVEADLPVGGSHQLVAEYVAVAKLQADAFVTLDADLARRLDGVVPIEPIEALRR